MGRAYGILVMAWVPWSAILAYLVWQFGASDHAGWTEGAILVLAAATVAGIVFLVRYDREHRDPDVVIKAMSPLGWVVWLLASAVLNIGITMAADAAGIGPGTYSRNFLGVLVPSGCVLLVPVCQRYVRLPD